MPYKNLPKSLWGKMERCVAKVEAQGKVKNPYAVCYETLTRARKKYAKKKTT